MPPGSHDQGDRLSEELWYSIHYIVLSALFVIGVAG
jgi:hypothetical protein